MKIQNSMIFVKKKLIINVLKINIIKLEIVVIIQDNTVLLHIVYVKHILPKKIL